MENSDPNATQKPRRFGLVLFLATGFGFGYCPVAPGTFGALWGIPLTWAIAQLSAMLLPASGMLTQASIQAVIILIIVTLGVPLCTAAATLFGGTKDPKQVVWDEIATMPIVFLLVPASFLTFAWPWVLEAVMLALKYPNVFIDTSCLYFDNPVDFINFVMTRQVPITVIERSLRHQIVFGSNYPRVEIKNMVKAVKGLGLSESTLELIFKSNAEKLLGEVS